MVYEEGNQELKDELVRGLVSTLSEGRKLAAQSVAAETQLFSVGALGTSPDGENITTYQSVLSLASDMNQPDLVYKFLSLASHNQVWNSRIGATMGFSNIAKQAKQELEPYISQLIPKLYRYQYDPNSKTAEAMKNIWRTLITDSKALDIYFGAIITELLKTIGDRQWRTREARYFKTYLVVRHLEISLAAGKWKNLKYIWKTSGQ